MTNNARTETNRKDVQDEQEFRRFKDLSRLSTVSSFESSVRSVFSDRTQSWHREKEQTIAITPKIYNNAGFAIINRLRWDVQRWLAGQAGETFFSDHNFR